jgi:hypothetical protein
MANSFLNFGYHVDFSGLNLMMMLSHVLQQAMQWKEILVEHRMMTGVCIIHPRICWFIYVKIVKVNTVCKCEEFDSDF